jgi:hypothetical protein
MSPQNLTQNPQNPSGSGAGGGFEYFEDGSRRVETLMAELSGLGVVLRIDGDRLAFDAPEGVLVGDLLARVRADRAGLVAMLSRAVDPPAADPAPSDRAPSIRCPCGGFDLADDPGGLRCRSCRSIAWAATADGGLVRRDVVDEGSVVIDPGEVPICPGCGRWCDVMTMAEAWRCSRCDPEADERRRRTLRVIGLVNRSRGRTVPSVR